MRWQFGQDAAHEVSNPSVSDQARQGEALVESLQAQIWPRSFDESQFHEDRLA